MYINEQKNKQKRSTSKKRNNNVIFPPDYLTLLYFSQNVPGTESVWSCRTSQATAVTAGRPTERQVREMTSRETSCRWRGTTSTAVLSAQTPPTSLPLAGHSETRRRRNAGKMTWMRIQTGSESEAVCRCSTSRSFGELDRSVKNHDQLLYLFVPVISECGHIPYFCVPCCASPYLPTRAESFYIQLQYPPGLRRFAPTRRTANFIINSTVTFRKVSPQRLSRHYSHCAVNWWTRALAYTGTITPADSATEVELPSRSRSYAFASQRSSQIGVCHLQATRSQRSISPVICSGLVNLLPHWTRPSLVRNYYRCASRWGRSTHLSWAVLRCKLNALATVAAFWLVSACIARANFRTFFSACFRYLHWLRCVALNFTQSHYVRCVCCVR